MEDIATYYTKALKLTTIILHTTCMTLDINRCIPSPTCIQPLVKCLSQSEIFGSCKCINWARQYNCHAAAGTRSAHTYSCLVQTMATHFPPCHHLPTTGCIKESMLYGSNTPHELESQDTKQISKCATDCEHNSLTVYTCTHSHTHTTCT